LLPTQFPPWQVSVWVHAFPSLQTVPSILAGLLHVPVAPSQVPASWHWSLAVHTTGLLPVQVPIWQVSVWVHAFPSSQTTPSVLAGLLHAPVAGSQVPASWHWSLAVHTTELLPVHAPAWQVSVCVHALPSLQTVPSIFAGLLHVPVAPSQLPTSWHWSAAVQVTGLLPTQLPAWQVSVCVHAFPSLQIVPSIFAGLLHVPVAGSQIPASWHWSLAVHTTP
jgi:hypothetical protein